MDQNLPLTWKTSTRSHGPLSIEQTQTGTDASPDDLLLGESRKAEGPFEKVSPDDVRPSADLPDRDPRNGLTDEWRVVPGDRLVTFKPDALPESRRISAVSVF